MLSRPLPLWAFFAIGLGALVTGVGIGLAGLDEIELDCTRERCIVTHSFPASSVETSLAHVRGAKLAVTGTRARSIYLDLVDDRGEPIRLLTIRQRDPEELLTNVQEMMNGAYDHVHSNQGRDGSLLGTAVMLLVSGACWLVVGIRRARGRGAPPRPAPERPAPPLAPAWDANRWMLLIAGMSVVGVLVNIALLRGAELSPAGHLMIDARQRCEYDGLMILPGSVKELNVEPGQHTIRVWTPDAPGKWTEHEITVELEGVTTFVCTPP